MGPHMSVVVAAVILDQRILTGILQQTPRAMTLRAEAVGHGMLASMALNREAGADGVGRRLLVILRVSFYE